MKGVSAIPDRVPAGLDRAPGGGFLSEDSVFMKADSEQLIMSGR